MSPTRTATAKLTTPSTATVSGRPAEKFPPPRAPFPSVRQGHPLRHDSLEDVRRAQPERHLVVLVPEGVCDARMIVPYLRANQDVLPSPNVERRRASAHLVPRVDREGRRERSAGGPS